jgi:hypothetical protein
MDSSLYRTIVDVVNQQISNREYFEAVQTILKDSRVKILIAIFIALGTAKFVIEILIDIFYYALFVCVIVATIDIIYKQIFLIQDGFSSDIRAWIMKRFSSVSVSMPTVQLT